MPKLPRDISGEAFIKVLCRDWAYRRVHQSGSHVILETDKPSKQQIAVPDHKALRIGTLNSLLRIIAQHKNVSREAIVDALK